MKTLINRAIAWTENLTVLEGHGEVLNDGCRGYRVEELKKESSPQAKTLQNINGSLAMFQRDM